MNLSTQSPRAWSVFFLISFAFMIPLWGLIDLLGRLESSDRDASLSVASDNLAQMTAHLVRLSQPEARFKELIGRVCRKLSAGESTVPLLTTQPGSLLLVYGFAPQGKRIFRPGFASNLVRTSEIFLAGLLNISEGKATTLKREDRRIVESFAGNSEVVEFLAHRPDQLLDLRSLGVNRLAGWFRVSNSRSGNIHLLIFVDRGLISPPELVQNAIRKMHSLAPNPFSFFALDLRSFFSPKNQGTRIPHISNPHHHSMRRSPKGPSPSDFRRGISPNRPPLTLSPSLKQKLLEDRLSQTFQTRRNLFSTSLLQSGFRLISQCPIPQANSTFSLAKGFICSFAGISFLAGLWCMVFLHGFAISIRSQLMLIFGTAGFLSLTVLLIIAQVYRESRVRELIRENQARSARVLEKIDNSFRPAFHHLIKTYREMITRLEDYPQDVSKTLFPLHNEQKTRRLLTACLIATNGAFLFRTPLKSDQVPSGILPLGSEALLSGIGKQALSRYNATFISRGKKEERSSSMQVVLERPVDQILRERGSLQSFFLAGEGTTIFIDMVLEPSGQARSILMALHDTRRMESAYLRRMFHIFQRHSSLRIYAFPKAEESGLSVIPSARLLQEEDLTNLQEHLSRFGGVEHRIGSLKRTPVLLSGFPGQSLSDFNLLLATPYLPILAQASSLSHRFLLLAGIFAGFAFLLASVLAKHLLEPIGHLEEGIENLLSMRLDKQICLDSGDELGSIGAGINTIMADLKEMTLARTVQEQLLPRKSFCLGSLTGRGSTRSPKAIAGGFYDIFSPDTKRMAIMIGEISGAGLSSALIMAMTKMAIHLFLDEGDCKPAEVLEKLNTFLRRSLRKPLSMNFFLGLIEPETGFCRFSAAGNPGVYLLPRAGGRGSLSIHASFLGEHDFPGFIEDTCHIGKQDRLLLLNHELSGLFLDFPETSIRDLQQISFADFGEHLFLELDRTLGSTAFSGEQNLLLIERRDEVGNPSILRSTFPEVRKSLG
ncbi:MAG: SpoIIE family protein phosphatase [Candidatus Ozemobacteraceae bacterium]